MTLTVILMSVQVLLLGGLLAATPWLMPPTECFAVTVPPSARQDPRIKRYFRRYAAITGALAIICTLVLLFMLPWFIADSPASEHAALGASLLITAATLTPIIVAMALMLYFRRHVQALKQAEGWTVSARKAAAIVGEDVLRPISLAWYLLYVMLTLAMVVFALMMYNQFPSQIPMNIDLSGHVTHYVDKSMGAVLFPAITVGYVGLIFTICHWFIIISKRPTDPAAPATSTLAYERFARIQSQVMLVGGLLLSAGIGCTYYLSALGVVSMNVALAILAIIILLFAGGMALVAVRLGQSGSRLARELRPNNEIARDDDAHWILGTIYFNRDDPSIVVPKRFGFGWTMNCAQPAAWAAVALIALITLLFVLLIHKAVGSGVGVNAV